ncbi:MAG: hypothetical protein U1C71_04730, partial [archaeon]|nr:hypothetical protein [archaeon]
ELKVIQFSLFPNEGLREGDTYFGRIRVIAGDDSREIIIQASKEDTPISPFAGLAALSLGDGAQIVDALLILIVIVLGISLIFRLRNRM